MTVRTSAGIRVYIAPVAAATVDTLSEIKALTGWQEVGEVEDLGEFGDEAGQAEFTSLANRRVRKLKTTFDAGTMTVQCGSDPSDVGQIAMVAALASDFDFPFKVVLNDKLTPTGTPTGLYFLGKVMSKRRNIGNVTNVTKQNFNVAINTEIFEDPAT